MIGLAKVGITETVLRDAHQSLIATRMTTEEMLPVLEQLDDIGFRSLECWGGATFDSCLRFLGEDPWERLRTLKKHMPKTPLQMLFRGQNMLGYRHYADDVVEYFVQKSVANGIDVIRIFDALNDIRNLETSIKAAKKEQGAHVQVAMSYTTSPVHNIDYFVKYAKVIEETGADSICIKDMAGLLVPYETYDLVKAIKETVKIPVQIHSHFTAGIADMVMIKAIEAGADVIDTAMSPLALGTSHPATEAMVAALKGTPYDTGLDLKKLSEISAYFRTLRKKYLDSGLLNPKMLEVDTNALIYQITTYADEHFEENLTLDYISHKFGISVTYFCKIFKRIMGMTFVEYLTDRRIKEAMRLIRHTDLPNYAIAQRIGFQNPEYFSKTFKKLTGITPKEYKRSADTNPEGAQKR